MLLWIIPTLLNSYVSNCYMIYVSNCYVICVSNWYMIYVSNCYMICLYEYVPCVVLFRVAANR